MALEAPRLRIPASLALATALLASPGILASGAPPPAWASAVLAAASDAADAAARGDLQAPLLLAAGAAGLPARRALPPAGPASLEEALVALWEAAGLKPNASARSELARRAAALEPRLAEGLALLVAALAEAQREAAGAGSSPRLAGTVRGALLVLAAIEAAEPALREAARLAPGSTFLEPAGLVRVSGAGSNLHAEEGPRGRVLDLDLGGDDRYGGAVGAAAAARSADAGPCTISAPGPPGEAMVACAAPLVSVSVDLGGNDAYEALSRSCGSARLGIGILLDLGGADTYACGSESEGWGSAGVGLLLDAGGDDVYRCAWDCQGHGRGLGLGVLADLQGLDSYAAGAWSQGVGFNNAAAGTGVGVLLDAQGDDRYAAGERAQGASENIGAGLLVEGGGNDLYDLAAANAGRGLVAGFFPYSYGLAVFLDRDGADTYLEAPGADGARWFWAQPWRALGVGLDCGGAACA